MSLSLPGNGYGNTFEDEREKIGQTNARIVSVFGACIPILWTGIIHLQIYKPFGIKIIGIKPVKLTGFLMCDMNVAFDRLL